MANSKRMWLISLCVAAAASVAAGCIVDGPPKTGQTVYPPTVEMTADDDVINFGESTTVRYRSEGADYCESDQGEQSLNGVWVVSPTITTTYSIACYGPGGFDIGEVTVTVRQPPPVAISLTATPLTIRVGEKSVLKWNSTNAVGGCRQSGSWNDNSTSGTLDFWPQQAGTYNFFMICYGPPGSGLSTSTDTNITVLPALPTVSLSVTPSPIRVGEAITFRWSSTNAVGRLVPSGSWQAPQGLNQNGEWTTTGPISVGVYHYWLTATGADGSTVSTDATLTVLPAGCHGGGLYFSNTQVNTQISYCKRWDVNGDFAGYVAKANLVWGGDGACAITCHDAAGFTVLPLAVTGVSVPGSSQDVQRWYTTGCRRLPDHPANEPNQAGGTHNGRCDLPVTTLAGPPNTNF